MIRIAVGLVVAAIATPLLHAFSHPLFHTALSWPMSALGGVVLGFGGWLAWFLFCDDVDGGDW